MVDHLNGINVNYQIQALATSFQANYLTIPALGKDYYHIALGCEIDLNT
jgi:hypothetical protein